MPVNLSELDVMDGPVNERAPTRVDDRPPRVTTTFRLKFVLPGRVHTRFVLSTVIVTPVQARVPTVTFVA